MPKNKQIHNHPEAMIRIGATIGIPAALRSLELDPEEVLLEGGFDIGLFDNPDNLISYSARGRLINHCTLRSNCQHFSLLVGQNANLRSLGIMGLLVKHSPDVRTALDNLVRYFYLHAHGAELSFRIDSGIAILGYHTNQIDAPANNQVGAGAVAVMFNILRELCGDKWQPREVWFMLPQPGDTRPFREFFRTHIRFNSEQNGIAFLASWLNQPIAEAHPDLYKLAQQQINSLTNQPSNDFPEQVRSIIRTAILRGDCKAAKVAALFSMQTRTFNRRLQAYGIGFQELVDECRNAIALEMLKDSDQKVSRIALILNYADTKSFIRAFRRWNGTTPARWRTEQKPSWRT